MFYNLGAMAVLSDTQSVHVCLLYGMDLLLKSVKVYVHTPSFF